MKVTRFECPLYASNVYLLENDSSSQAWLVDIGTANLPVPNEKNVAGVFITHTHIDHIQGINALIERYPDCVIYTSEEGRVGLKDDKVNLTYYHQQPLCFKGGKIQIVKEGDSVPLFNGVDMRFIETPGHHPSCLCFQVDNYLFTGDSYIPNVPVVTRLKGGNRVQAAESVKKIMAMAKDGMVICPGHGEEIGIH